MPTRRATPVVVFRGRGIERRGPRCVEASEALGNFPQRLGQLGMTGRQTIPGNRFSSSHGGHRFVQKFGEPDLLVWSEPLPSLRGNIPR